MLVVLGCSAFLCALEPAPPSASEARLNDARTLKVRGLIGAGKYAEAEAEARDLATAIGAETGSDSLATAQAIDLVVEILGRAVKGGQPEARALGERAVRIKAKLLDPRDPENAVSLNNLGAILRLSGDNPGARAAYRRSVEIREAALGPEHTLVAESLGGLAGALQDTGDLAGALPLYRRALAIRKKALPPDHPDLAASLSNLGIVLRNSGEYTGAIDAQKAALAIREKSLPPDHPDTSLTLGNLGVLYHLTGDYSAARAIFERVLPMREKAFGPINPRVAESLTDMADLARDTGDYDEAKELYDRAIKVWSATLGPRHPYTALALEGLARLLRAMGDLAGAEPLLRQSLDIWRQAGPDHPLVAINMQDLADVLREKGEFAAARPFYEQALAICEKAGAPNQPEIAMSLTGLADLLRDMGDYSGAKPLYERSLRIRMTALGARHPRVAENLNELAKLSWARGDLSTALNQALEAESITREHLQLTARSLSEREALLYEAIRASGLDVAFSILAAGVSSGTEPGAPARVWDELVRSRAIVLDEMASRHRTTFELERPQLSPLMRDLDSARAAYARLAVRGRPEERPEQYRLALEQSRAAMELAERNLAARSGVYRQHVAKSRMGIAQVAAGVPPDTAMLAYVQYRRFTLIGAGSKRVLSAPVPSYLALLKRPSDSSVIVIPLGPSETIDRLVRAWREQAGSPATDLQAVARYTRAGEELRRAAWDPMAGRLAGVRRVFVVPDGAINAVNISTLPTASDRYLIETGPMIHYLSAERDVIAAPVRRGSDRGMLVLGGPDYDAGFAGTAASTTRGASGAGPCAELQTMRFQPLPSARLEADDVEALWMKNGRPVLKLTGIQASESMFKKDAGGRDVLHLATHGFVIDGGCAPLQLSGLALAGANLRGAGGSGFDSGEDGILTAEEIASLDLRGVGWAVLSGCETGVGPVRAGEGVVGLRRAFEVAGAATLILSLWSVSDHETRDWVHELYKSRLAGKSSVESVRNACLKMLDNRRQSRVTTHPYYWGGFVEAGDWR